MKRLALVATTPEYRTLRSSEGSMNEKNDCAVIAIALVCGVPYETAHEVLAAEGRKNGGKTSHIEMRNAIGILGKVIVDVQPVSFFDRYPARFQKCVTKTVTSRHPVKFPKAWKDGKTYLAITTRHALTIIDGVVHDWSVNRSLPIKMIWMIVDKSEGI